MQAAGGELVLVDKLGDVPGLDEEPAVHRERAAGGEAGEVLAGAEEVLGQ